MIAAFCIRVPDWGKEGKKEIGTSHEVLKLEQPYPFHTGDASCNCAAEHHADYPGAGLATGVRRSPTVDITRRLLCLFLL